MKVSVITVCFNAAATIEKTIQSVLSQTYSDVEYIIVDGKSTDGTMAIVDRYRDRIQKIISEPDGGIYDAMNKGLCLSSGDVIYFLNANDVFYSSSIIADVVLAFERSPAVDIIYGKVFLQNLPQRKVYDYQSPYVEKIDSARDILRKGMCQQRIFACKRVFEKIGTFNAQYKICADFDWFIICYLAKVPMMFFDCFVCYYDAQGVSAIQTTRMVKEKLSIVRSRFSSLLFLYYLVVGIKRFVLTRLCFDRHELG